MIEIIQVYLAISIAICLFLWTLGRKDSLLADKFAECSLICRFQEFFLVEKTFNQYRKPLLSGEWDAHPFLAFRCPIVLLLCGFLKAASRHLSSATKPARQNWYFASGTGPWCNICNVLVENRRSGAQVADFVSTSGVFQLFRICHELFAKNRFWTQFGQIWLVTHFSSSVAEFMSKRKTKEYLDRLQDTLIWPFDLNMLYRRTFVQKILQCSQPWFWWSFKVLCLERCWDDVMQTQFWSLKPGQLHSWKSQCLSQHTIKTYL